MVWAPVMATQCTTVAGITVIQISLLLNRQEKKDLDRANQEQDPLAVKDVKLSNTS